jgi:hypothetical protein
MCDANAAKRTKQAEDAARSKLEMVCPNNPGVLSWGQILKDIDTFIANCTVRARIQALLVVTGCTCMCVHLLWHAVQVQHVSLEANLKKLKIYLSQQMKHEQAKKQAKQDRKHVPSSDEDRDYLLAERQTRISIFGLTQHICEHYAALLESDLLSLLSDTLVWAGFPDAAKSLRKEWRSALAVVDKAQAAKPMANDIREVRQMLAAMEPRQSVPAVDFQLDHMGHLLSRKVLSPSSFPLPTAVFSYTSLTTASLLLQSLGSRSDPRVTFTPDDWQIKLLDVVDRYVPYHTHVRARRFAHSLIRPSIHSLELVTGTDQLSCAHPRHQERRSFRTTAWKRYARTPRHSR